MRTNCSFREPNDTTVSDTKQPRSVYYFVPYLTDLKTNFLCLLIVGKLLGYHHSVN